MALNKKAQIEEYPMWYVIFFAMIVAICAALIGMPTYLVVKTIPQVPMDQVDQARIIHSNLWATNPYTGRTTPYEYTDDLTQVEKTVTRKLMTYKVSIDGKQAIYDKEFYDIAAPIAPFRYLGYSEKRNVKVKGTNKQLTIEQYNPHTYEIRPT
jgi:hypothetical protein